MSDNTKNSGEKTEGKPYLPIAIFFALLVGPYILFLILLMLLTGHTDIALLYNSIMQESNDVLIKGWVIGTFVLAILGTFYITSQQTKQLIKLQRQQAREAKFNATRDRHSGFTIEKTDEHPDSEAGWQKGGKFKSDDA